MPTLNVPVWLWLAPLGGLFVLLLLDLVVIGRKPHNVTIGEASRWVAFYVGCAVAFGIGIWVFAGPEHAASYLTGYITEYSLSVDNLFVFVVIMSTFAVPTIHQSKVLLIGILIALVMRGIFIAIGAQLVQQFSWVFWIFGGFLIYTAWKLAFKKGEDEEYRENAVTRLARKALPVTDDYHGAKTFVKVDGKFLLTPMFVVMIAIGSADLLFAVDSIPAIFGITQEPYLVFTTNAFALMGLRQLYFLIGGLLDRLVYLSVGLAAILAFIGLKLLLQALHENELPFINSGENVTAVPEINNWVSLGVIVLILTITTAASLIKRKDRATLDGG